MPSPVTDLKTQFLDGTALIFRTFESLKQDIVLVYGRGVYNPNTGKTSAGTQTATIRGFILSPSEAQGGDSSGKSAQVLLQNSDVVAAGLSAIVDQASKVIANGFTWEVDGVRYDPIRATVKLMVRRG